MWLQLKCFLFAYRRVECRGRTDWFPSRKGGRKKGGENGWFEDWEDAWVGWLCAQFGPLPGPPNEWMGSTREGQLDLLPNQLLPSLRSSLSLHGVIHSSIHNLEQLSNTDLWMTYDILITDLVELTLTPTPVLLVSRTSDTHTDTFVLGVEIRHWHRH